MSFPEEQLDSPSGYFTVQIGQKLDNGWWTIVRKLGWGARSSTWMAVNNGGDEYVAVKIFTTAATQDLSAANEEKFLYLMQDISSNIPHIVEHFYEQSSQGEHLCLALFPLTFSVETLRCSNSEEGQYLPLHMVQKIVPDILEVLGGLEDNEIIHGAVLPDNFLFWSLESAHDIDPEIEQNPCYEMTQVIGNYGKEYLTVKSQPMPQSFKWNDTRELFDSAAVYLSNFSHARSVAEPVPFKSPSNYLPPEALLGGKVDCSVNIWMLGCTAYLLATGTPLFSDSYVSSPLKVLDETLPKLEELLAQNGKVSTQDIPMFASFLRMCLVSDPGKRAKFADIFQLEWIDQGIMCSCRWCTSSQSKRL